MSKVSIKVVFLKTFQCFFRYAFYYARSNLCSDYFFEMNFAKKFIEIDSIRVLVGGKSVNR